MSPVSRRSFVGAASASLLASGVHGARQPAQAPRPSDKLHVGVIGVGNRGVDNIAGVAGENIAALCDVDQRHLDAMSARFPKAKKYVDFRKLLEQPDLDAVVVCTPDHTHAVAASAALVRGLHVYCERPLAHNIAEVRHLADLAKRSKVATQMGNQHHSSRGYRRAAQILQAGVLGELREAHVWTSRPLWPQGIPRPKEQPPLPKSLAWDLWLGPAAVRPYHAAYHPMNWRGFWDFGTGALGDFGPHILDPIVTGLKLTAPSRVTAKTSAINEETAPKWSVVTYEFPPLNNRPAVKLTWYDGGKQPAEEITGIKRLPPNGAILIGKHGKLFIPELGRAPAISPVDRNDKPALPDPPPPPPGDHWHNWLTACKTGKPANSNFTYAAQLTEICLLGNAAIRTGNPIDWNPAIARITNIPAANQHLSREYRRGWVLPQ